MNTRTVQMTDFLTYIGVNDRETARFENLWPLDKGVAYNSYLMTGEKTCLMDTVKVNKVDVFLEKLDEALDGRELDYLVIHHMEPDHSSSIQNLLVEYPNVKLVGNKKTIEFLKDFYGITENILEVKDGDELDLGDRKLVFYTTPMLHWPESMVSFEVNSGVLFSQDAFGAFGTLDGAIFDDEINWDNHKDEMARYYTNIVGKHSRQVQVALKKLSGLDIKMICPVHGPVWRENPGRVVELYDRLSKYQSQNGVVIVYGSMYGNTEEMADILARELVENGVRNVQVFDVSKTHPSYLLNEIWKNKGVLLGSCSYHNGLYPNMLHLVNILEENKIQNHILGLFGSYSWSGGGVRGLQAFADGQKFQVLETIPQAKCSAKGEDIDGLRTLAKEMADALKENPADFESLLEV